MTKEETLKTAEYHQQCADAFRAAAEGKSIQIQRPNGKWEDADIKNGWVYCQDYQSFRIKPEPTYRPYTADKFDLALSNHSNFLREKTKSMRNSIGWYDGTAVGFVTTIPVETYDKLLEKFVWADDNSACGVLTDNNE